MNKLPFSLLLALLLLAVSVAQTPQRQRPAQDDLTVRIGTKLVQIDVAVTDKNEQVVRDLKLDNFDRDTSIEVKAIVLRQVTGGPEVGTELSSWDKAKPTDGIRVRITGNYKPSLPVLLKMDSTITLQTQSIMYSEGN